MKAHWNVLYPRMACATIVPLPIDVEAIDLGPGHIEACLMRSSYSVSCFVLCQFWDWLYRKVLVEQEFCPGLERPRNGLSSVTEVSDPKRRPVW